MFSARTIAAVAALSSLSLVSAAPASSSAIAIPFPTGDAAVTAAPAVPTFDTGLEQPDVAGAAAGAANVRNHCGFEVYIYTCNQQSCGGIINVAAGGTWSTSIGTAVNDGVSIKIGTTTGEVAKPILQFEYTPTTSQVYFDLSEVNGNPFGPYGFTLTDSAGLSEHCAPPGTSCPGVFTTPTNGDVYAVPITDSIGVTLCG